MLLDFDADISGAQALLEQVAGRLEGPEMLHLLGDSMSTYMDEVFATGNFGQWAPLDPETVARKGSGRILVDTGGLLEDLTRSGDISGESVEVTTDERAAPYLKAGARGMPVRDPAPEPPGSVVNEWARELLGFVTGGYV